MRSMVPLLHDMTRLAKNWFGIAIKKGTVELTDHDEQKAKMRRWLILHPRDVSIGMFGVLAAITAVGIIGIDHGNSEFSAASESSAWTFFTLMFGLAIDGFLALSVYALLFKAGADEAQQEWFEQQESIRNVLTRELNHRVRNTLANVLSIISLSRRRVTDIDDFTTALIGRIGALTATHDLLTRSDWGEIPVRSVIEAELLSHVQLDEHSVVIEGANVALAPNDALQLGLAIHELSTNAAKFGALSQPGGSVSVRWTSLSELLLRLDWVESGGPAVSAEVRRGFGLDLIERVVAQELRKPVKFEFAPEGLRCQICITVRPAHVFKLRAQQRANG